MEMNAITVKNLTKIFDVRNKSLGSVFGFKSYNQGKINAIKNISFHISKGEIVGIIGLNGSGKTTLLRIISGIYHPTSGNVQVNGIMAPLLQLGTGFHKELVASENIVMYGMLLGINKFEIEKKIPQILEFAGLKKFSNLKFKNYSSGMQTRLAFSIALQINPDILVVDEILSVGDINFREKSFNAFRSFKEKGKTVLYATHNLKTLPELCDRVLLMHEGELVIDGHPDEVIKKYHHIRKSKS